jgi:hypothetical protein
MVERIVSLTSPYSTGAASYHWCLRRQHIPLVILAMHVAIMSWQTSLQKLMANRRLEEITLEA